MSDGSRSYPWWDVAEGESILQGDLLMELEIPVPTGVAAPNAEIVDAQGKKFNVVILTQSCDIEHGKVQSLLCCPWWDLWQFIEEAQKQGQNWGKEQMDALRRGNLPGYHLVNEASEGGLLIGLGIVDFHEVYTVPLHVAREFCRTVGKRLRLLPPYREHMAQAFARFFMRVGLPVDIPKEKLLKPSKVAP